MKQTLYKFIILLVTVAWSVSASAQFTTSGTVTDSKGEALIGVSVAVENTNLGTVTDLDGSYSIYIPGSSATLSFSYVGHRSQEKPVTASSGNVSVVLEETSSELDEVIISGLATTVKRSNAANSVSQVNAAQLTGITTESTLDGALYGKFTGAQIISNSGAPGGGYNIRMRGITSIYGPSQPLFIVDGVYVDNSSIPVGLNTVTNAAGGGNTAIYDQDNPSNRIADIDPGDIESIEILKGASAAAIYGQRAAAGVVIITTKRGKLNSGGANIQFSQSLGWQQALHLLGVRQWDEQKVSDFYGPAEVANFTAAQSSGKLYDYEKELFGNHGLLSDSRLSLSGGTTKTSYFASASYKNEDGIVLNTGYRKTDLRVNVNSAVTQHIDLAISTNYVKSSADRGLFGNDNTSTTMSIALAGTPTWADLFPDAEGNYPDNPYSASNFLQTRDLMTNNEAVDRFIGSASITGKIIATDRNSLKLILNGGLDEYNLATKAIFPRELQFEKNGNGTNGASVQGNTVNFNNNESAFLVHTFFPASQKFSFRTQGGLTRESFKQDFKLITATQLIGTQTNVDQAGSVVLDEQRKDQIDFGGFGQEEFNYSDMVIATVGVRGDKSSNNGDVNKIYWSPKASLALNISEMGFWSIDNWNQFKLRAAFGQSSNFAPYGSKYTGLSGVIIDGQSGSLINTQLGNPNITPETLQEVEFGTDLGFFDSRLEFEFTYYVKQVKDMLLQSRIPGSSGYGTQWVNGADLKNHGVELSMNADVVKTTKFDWFSTVNFWLNRSEITRLDVPAFQIGSFGTVLGTYYIDTGKSVTQIVGIGPDSLVDSNSPYVKWGDSEPDFQMSFNEQVSYKNFSLAFDLNWKKGGQGVNLTTLLTDIFGTSADYDATTLDPSGQLTNGQYRLSQLGSSAAAMVENAGYVRLREVGLYYTFNAKKLSDATNGTIRGLKLGLSAYNALNWFNYSGYDPEVSNFGLNNISTGIEVNPYPSAKRFYGSVTVNF